MRETVSHFILTGGRDFCSVPLGKFSAVGGEEKDQAGEAEQQPRERRSTVPRLGRGGNFTAGFGMRLDVHGGRSISVQIRVRHCFFHRKLLKHGTGKCVFQGVFSRKLRNCSMAFKRYIASVDQLPRSEHALCHPFFTN